jgi:hypothetical protein
MNCLSAGNFFMTKFTSKFSPTASSRSVFHVGVIQKYSLLWSIPYNNGTHCSLIVTENKRLMELITAAHCWQIITSSHARTALLAVKHNVVKESTKIITPLNSKCYRPSGILIHRQNSYTPSSRRCIGRRGVQRREQVNKIKNIPVLFDAI